MAPVDDVGRVIVVDFDRESVAQPVPLREFGTADEHRTAPWPAIGEPQWRSLKRSIVEAGAAGAISAETAHRMINRFGLREI